jgi:UDP-N-acetylmuramoyl-tripeptide--D-alanyl-D-alanine ligase
LVFICSVLLENFILKRNLTLAQKKIKEVNPIIIGITGSCGKTSCKNYLEKVLSTNYRVLASPKSYNTLNGVCMTINKFLKNYHEILILELGVDKIDGMDKFIRNFSFDISVVTCIQSQHIKTFKTIENIYKEKSKLLKCAKKMAFINNDDLFLNHTTSGNKQISFSTNSESDVIVKYMNTDEHLVSNYILKINNKEFRGTTKLLGEHNMLNIACVSAIANFLSIPIEDIIKSFTKIQNVDHRLSSFKIGNWVILDDAYNSNFKGFESSLNTLKLFEDHYKILITPGVVEQNKETEENDINLSKQINEICDLTILINNPRIKKHILKYLSFNEFADAYNYLKKNYRDKKCVILIENDVPNIYLR